MRRVLLLALGVALLAVPAATAAPQPCWKRVIMDWYADGKIDGSWRCNCVREAIEHLPSDGGPAYSNVMPVLVAARKRACRPVAAEGSQQVVARRPAPEKHSRNLPALITSTVLGVIVFVLFWRRRRQLLERRRRDRS